MNARLLLFIIATVELEGNDSMEQLLPFLLFLLGFIMIIKGSDWFIDSTIWIAKILNVPNIIIGATLVSLCTTLPEAMVSTSSALKGNGEIAFGNAIGSIACNTGFILGLSILLSRPVIKEKLDFQKKGLLLISLLIALMGVGYVFEEIPRYAGFILIIILVIYLGNNVKAALTKPYDGENTAIDKSMTTMIRMIVLFVIGLILTIVGANLLVENGEDIARLLGVPDVVIGLTLTAFGTSLPELVTAITSYVKKAGDLSVGNIIGANLMNILLVIAAATSIYPIQVEPTYLTFHVPFVILIVCIPVLASFSRKNYFSRMAGLFMMITYLLYMGLTIS